MLQKAQSSSSQWGGLTRVIILTHPTAQVHLDKEIMTIYITILNWTPYFVNLLRQRYLDTVILLYLNFLKVVFFLVKIII